MNFLREISAVKKYFSIILIIACSFVLYAISLSYPFVWDDKMLIKENRQLESIENIDEAFTSHYLASINEKHNTTPYYRPISLGFIFIEYSLFQKDSTGYRVVSIAIHTANALMIFFIIAFILKKQSLDANKLLWTSTFSSILFLTLPYTADAVLLISNQGDLLALFFMLLSIIIIFQPKDIPNRLFFPLIIFLSFLASGSKESGVSLLLILGVLTWTNPFTTSKTRLTKALIATSAGTLLYLSMRLFVVETSSGINPVQAFIRYFSDFAIALRWAIAPHPLALEETAPKIFFDLWWWIGLILLTAIISTSTYFKKTKPLFSTLLLSWIILITPSLLSINTNNIFSLRYLYTPAVVIVILSGLLFSKASKPIKYALIPLLISLLLLTIIRISAWRSDVSFWSLESQRHPNSASALINLASAYEQSQNFAFAIKTYDKAITAATFEKSATLIAHTNYRLGYLVDKTFNDKSRALQHYNVATKISPSFETWLLKADAHIYFNEIATAKKSYMEAKKLAKNNPQYLNIVNKRILSIKHR